MTFSTVREHESWISWYGRRNEPTGQSSPRVFVSNVFACSIGLRTSFLPKTRTLYFGSARIVQAKNRRLVLSSCVHHVLDLFHIRLQFILFGIDFFTFVVIFIFAVAAQSCHYAHNILSYPSLFITANSDSVINSLLVRSIFIHSIFHFSYYSYVAVVAASPGTILGKCSLINKHF